MSSHKLSAYLCMAALAGLAGFPPILHGYFSLFCYALFFFSASSCFFKDKTVRPQLLLAGWVLIGISVLFTSFFHNLGALNGIFCLALCLLCFALGQVIFFKEKDREIFAYFFAFLVITELLLALYQLIYLDPQLKMQVELPYDVRGIAERERPQGSFVDPNILGSFLILVLPFLADFFWRTRQLWPKLLLAASSLAGLAGLFLCQSVGAITSLLGAILLLGIFATKNRLLRVASVGAFLMGFALVLARRNLFSWQQVLAQLRGRLVLWLPALEAWRQSPWFGHGPGLTEGPYRQAQAALQMGFGSYCHNIILNWLLMLGVVGLILALAWLFLLGTRVWQGFKFENASGGSFGIAVGLVAVFLHMQWDLASHMPEIFLGALFFAGALIGPQAAEANYSLYDGAVHEG